MKEGKGMKEKRNGERSKEKDRQRSGKGERNRRKRKEGGREGDSINQLTDKKITSIVLT
jgi:hypothetical protein